jgi:two-component system, LytTR family, sensor kinase
MTAERRAMRAGTRLALIFGAWTMLAVVQTTHLTLYRLGLGGPVNVWEIARLRLTDYWLWAALTPLIFRLARRYPFRRRTWPRALAIHALAFFALAATHDAVAALLGMPLPVPDGFHGSALLLRIAGSSYDNLWMYWPLVVISSFVETHQEVRAREAQAAELRERLTRAELQALRNQLDPHLLFNALNSVAALMHEDVQAADDMLADLSHLLRTYLTDGQQETSLGCELELLRAYVGIQQHRFDDRLSCVVDVPSELLGATVPALVLQPLVENAILHGIAPSPRPGQVRIRARRDGERLALEVSDDGVGLRAGHREEVGLSNTRARLRQLYGERHSFALQGGTGTGTGVVVSLTLPLRFGSAPAAKGVA